MTQPPYPSEQPYNYGQPTGNYGQPTGQPQQPQGTPPQGIPPQGYPPQYGQPGQYVQPAQPWQAGQYGFAQPTPPQPKKKRKWPWIILGVFVFFVIVANLGGGNSNPRTSTSQNSATLQNSGTSPNSPSAAAQAEQPAPGIGVPARDGQFEFVVQSWDAATSTVTMSVTNIGDSPQYFAISNQYLIDTQGRKFEGEYDWRSELDSTDLNPGQSVSGELKFVLSGATAAAMELHDSMFSGGTTVSLR